ncbi:MAG: NAD-glutamate dehydrogenase [Desulfuromonadaceae bacterium]|nr:NAD-glutamate dehydrogenase [Desulfuromonadaceae bacterium]
MASHSSHSDDLQKFHQLLDQLPQHLPDGLTRERREGFWTFFNVIRQNAVPGSLMNLSAMDLCMQLVSVYRVLESRHEDVAVKVLPIQDADQGLLVCSCVDAPFLFDSLLLFLRRKRVCWQVITHMRLHVRRQDNGIATIKDAELSLANESLLIVQVEDSVAADEMVSAIRDTLMEVQRVATDRGTLLYRLEKMRSVADHAGYAEFWNWLLNDNFTPLSYRQISVTTDEPRQAVVVPDSQLGLTVESQRSILDTPHRLDQCDPQTRICLTRPQDVAVTETGWRSPVWRDEFLTSVVLREPVADGRMVYHEFFGLYTSHSSQGSALDIPVLKKKIHAALETLHISPESYNFRKVEDLLSSFPKTELFFLKPDHLQDVIKSLLYYHHSSVRAVGLEVEPDSLILMLVIPRTLNPNTDFTQLEQYLKPACHADMISLRILHLSAENFILQVQATSATQVVLPDLENLNEELTLLLQSWEQRLRRALIDQLGSHQGMALWQPYHQAFGAHYRGRVDVEACVQDILCLERLRQSQQEQIDLREPSEDQPTVCQLQFYANRPGYLNELMPLLVNLELTIINEEDFYINLSEGEYYIKSFSVLNRLSGKESLASLKPRLIDALVALRRNLTENDYLNHLLVRTGLDWQQIDVFRAYRNYYFQLGSPFTKKSVAYALINNPRAALALSRYFEARFKPDPAWSDPLQREEQALSPARFELIESLKDVANVNEDRILRLMFNLIDSTVRTNFFKRRDQQEYFLSFKISAIGITDMPVPRPLFEIYVHNADMEGIHLRGGMVARGGIRWSDRPDDFRTEILGLMKTQMTKNALIVPVGSKGGFVVKTSYSDREEGMALSKKAYQTLMRGLLDLTDNRRAGQIIPAEGVVRYDGDDPYLVVAADKGTAHLPDTANAISADYGFWLADGFASGGSHGYDHKVLGITARGAWVCVQRHFRELGIDIQQQSISVVGIGDMSGDVFGNGMLLSDKIKLMAAFNHRHIFLDPDPDPAVSFAERTRLFALPRSGWNDYAAELISEGGGVFERSAKEIPLSPQVRQWLGVRYEALDGDTLIQLLLKAQVDLLWNGGIGTYVKSSQQDHTAAGDRANDSVRIDASQLRARVVGEGGNLGFTQRARIEYALLGGRINTDAIDNSAGVDCSDHEVNLKIFMQHLQEQHYVASLEERDRLLTEVTDDVCLSVLRNNYEQSLCLSLDEQRSQREPEVFTDLASRLQEVGLLDPVSESLPTPKEMVARGTGYSRPELAILLAYSKMHLYQALLQDEQSERAIEGRYLEQYFPEKIRQKFAGQIPEHPLHREIAATVMTNQVINYGGATLCFRLARRHNVTLPQVAELYLFYVEVLRAQDLRQQLFDLDNRLPGEEQYRWLMAIEDALMTLCDWSLRQHRYADMRQLPLLQQTVAQYTTLLSSVVSSTLWQDCHQQLEQLEQHGFSPQSALELVSLPFLDNLIPLIWLMERTGNDLHSLAVTLNDVMETFRIAFLLESLTRVPERDRWDHRTASLLRGRLMEAVFALVEKVMSEHQGNLDSLVSMNRRSMQRYKQYLDLLAKEKMLNFHPVMVVLDQIQKLV